MRLNKKLFTHLKEKYSNEKMFQNEVNYLVKHISVQIFPLRTIAKFTDAIHKKKTLITDVHPD